MRSIAARQEGRLTLHILPLAALAMVSVLRGASKQIEAVALRARVAAKEHTRQLNAYIYLLFVEGLIPVLTTFLVITS